MVECRIKLYSTLGTFALKQQHLYWGMRFWGWALHYLQDLTQPYHSSMLPGQSTIKLLLLSIFASKEKVNALVTLVSNRHLFVENYLFYKIKEQLITHNFSHPLIRALTLEDKDSIKLPNHISFAELAREVISLEAHERGNTTHAALIRSFPAKYVNDPHYNFSVSEKAFDSYQLLKTISGPKESLQLDQCLVDFMHSFGKVTNQVVESMQL
ncbi:MAG: hypothetical protein HQK52_23225 [Oligoflexia bacterium]|nr:hypothetical protein [Oligoflexia bacterium]